MLWYGSCCILKHVCAGEVYHCRMLFGGSLSWVEKWWCLTRTHREKWMNKYTTNWVPLVPSLCYIHWCLQSNIADGDVSRGVQYEFVMCRQQNRDGQVISTCNSSHIWENFSFFGPSLNWGTESKPLPQFGVRCVESVTLNQIVWEISDSHASLKWRTFIIDA